MRIGGGILKLQTMVNISADSTWQPLPEALLRLLYFAPILFAIPRDQTPNLTTILITN